MDPSQAIFRAGQAANKGGCDFQSRLGAYHDGELDTVSARQVEQHLASCESCRAELQEIRELSSLAETVGAEGISPIGVARVHQMIDAEAGSSVLRIAGLLTGLAASALVIGSAWLWETPQSRTSGQEIVVINPLGEPDMTLAMTLEPSAPLPHSPWEVRDQQMLADARLADFMVEGLTGR
jgi:hypothetical protein